MKKILLLTLLLIVFLTAHSALASSFFAITTPQVEYEKRVSLTKKDTVVTNDKGFTVSGDFLLFDKNIDNKELKPGSISISYYMLNLFDFLSWSANLNLRNPTTSTNLSTIVDDILTKGEDISFAPALSFNSQNILPSKIFSIYIGATAHIGYIFTKTIGTTTEEGFWNLKLSICGGFQLGNFFEFRLEYSKNDAEGSNHLIGSKIEKESFLKFILAAKISEVLPVLGKNTYLIYSYFRSYETKKDVIEFKIAKNYKF